MVAMLHDYLRVRFVAVNDHFDSLDGDPEALSVLLNNLVNELYAKDISVKVRSSKMKQFEKGSGLQIRGGG